MKRILLSIQLRFPQGAHRLVYASSVAGLIEMAGVYLFAAVAMGQAQKSDKRKNKVCAIFLMMKYCMYLGA